MSRNSGDNSHLLDESVNSNSVSPPILKIFCAPASQAPVERPFSTSGHILSQRRLRTSDKNFENILFANANFEVFDVELRKRKQPERDDDDE